jgi:UV excision repair protein RAD23
MGTQGEAVISQMEAMGFSRADIDRAMRAAFFNPDRAIEYLLNVSSATEEFV